MLWEVVNIMPPPSKEFPGHLTHTLIQCIGYSVELFKVICQDLCFRPVIVLMFFHCPSDSRMLVTSLNHLPVMHVLS